MAKFDPTMNAFWGVYASRYEDIDKIKEFADKSLTVWEAMTAECGVKWLFGTEEPTMLDVHAGGMWDLVYTHALNDSTYKTLHDTLDVKSKAPNWCAYMERFRAHPAVHKYRFRHLAVEKHGQRAKGWAPGVKCQLSLAVLEGVFEAEN